MAHSIYNIGDGCDFVIFNDQALNFEPIIAEDITRIEMECGYGPASMAWSSGCNYYFIVQDDGIALLNVHSKRGLLCRKKSARFIEMFLETQPPMKARRGKVA